MTNSWFFWSLASAAFAGATAILAKIGVSGVDSNLATAVRTTVVCVFAWAVSLAVNPIGSRLPKTAKSTAWAFCYFARLAFNRCRATISAHDARTPSTPAKPPPRSGLVQQG